MERKKRRESIIGKFFSAVTPNRKNRQNIPSFVASPMSVSQSLFSGETDPSSSKRTTNQTNTASPTKLIKVEYTSFVGQDASPQRFEASPFRISPKLEDDLDIRDSSGSTGSLKSKRKGHRLGLVSPLNENRGSSLTPRKKTSKSFLEQRPSNFQPPPRFDPSTLQFPSTPMESKRASSLEKPSPHDSDDSLEESLLLQIERSNKRRAQRVVDKSNPATAQPLRHVATQAETGSLENPIHRRKTKLMDRDQENQDSQTQFPTVNRRHSLHPRAEATRKKVLTMEVVKKRTPAKRDTLPLDWEESFFAKHL